VLNNEGIVMYDRKIKMYDEPHSPEHLEKKSAQLNSGKFLTAAHFSSYYLQMLTVRNLKAESVLEIGPGENFVANYMRTLGINYETMDIMESSQPSILGRLEDLDVTAYSERYDIVCAFQMLEHSPYDNFVPNLEKMAAMAKQYVLISLPYSCFGMKISFDFSFGQRIRLLKSFELFFPLNKKNRRYREEYMKEFPWAVHYWEIGRRGYPLRRIKSDIESAGLKIKQTFRSDNPYHFFICAEKHISKA
jgi:hypothetical protein